MNFITPFSNMSFFWILLFVCLVVPRCSTTTPIATPPPYHENLPPFYPDQSLIPNNNKNKPPPVFEYLKLAKVWAPTFCATEDCSHGIPSDFSLHGLWPQNKSDPQPLDCATNQKINIAEIQKDNQELVRNMRRYWPSLKRVTLAGDASFWVYEWTQHGTCAANIVPEEYFRLAIKISTDKDLKTILQSAGITPGDNPVDSTRIFNAISRDISAPEIECKKIENVFHLSEIRVCLDKSGAHYIDCVPGTPRGLLNKCPQHVMFKIKP